MNGSTHQEKHYSIFQIAFNLTMACLVSGIIIAITFFITNPVAQAKNVMLKNQAMKALVREANNFKPVEGKDGWYIAEKDNKLLAYIVPVESKGYGGIIKMMVAVTPDGKEIDYNILAHSETPGLGDNANKESFRSQFYDKTSDKLIVVKDPNNKENIQAMTGATISSKAVTDAVKEAAENVLELKEGK